MDDLVKRLRDGNASGRDKCKDMSDHFPCLEDCPCALELRVLADAARIEALEARVAAADALAAEMERLMRRTPFVPAMNGIAVTIAVDQIADQKAALAAYKATKEPSE